MSHSVAGHQLPHWIVVLLTLAITLPLCAQLSSVPLSRVRLGTAIGVSQLIFHGLFALFPASGGAGSTIISGSSGAHAAHQHGFTVDMATETGAASHIIPDAPMVLAHVLAGVFTYAVIRRGELLITAASAWLFLRPVLLLFLRPISLSGPWDIRAHHSYASVVLRDLWLDGAAQTLRGPPVLVS